ncbi:MAG: class C sortase [Faecousia sp.]
MSKKVKSSLVILFVLLFLASLCAVVYPYLSNYLAQQRQAEIVLQYDAAVGMVQDTDVSAALEAARAYNAALANGQENISDYDTLLNPTGNGMMGIITIPSIGVELPIYHGTQSLELGALHLQGTSLPVGGASTHCVISAHSGMSSEKMFTDLDQLAEGDVFYLKVYGETLAYEVDQILTVLPENVEPLMIAPGEDFCTLLTCTPYGVNTHRLLVRGRRIAFESETAGAEAQTPIHAKQSTWMQQYIRGILCGIGMVVSAAIACGCLFLIQRRRNGGKREKKQ